GLREAGFEEGRNVSIDFRATGDRTELPALAAELVRRRVDVIFSVGEPLSALAAQAATSTIPIVFTSGNDPILDGLVASLARRGGNVTGVTYFVEELTPKRLELLRELVPRVALIGVLTSPTVTPSGERVIADLQAAAQSVQQQIRVFEAGSADEI